MQSGKAIGGFARANSLSPERRVEIGKLAAEARWGRSIQEVTHGSDDSPLRIGGIEIPCYVLKDETRVITQRGMQTGMGMSTSGGSGAHRVAQFVESLAEKGIDCKDLAVRISEPIKFHPKGTGKLAYGYEATTLADICDAVLAAREAGVLQKQQEHIAKRCEILVRGFARTGIIALVDEATGYQRDRKRDALASILEAFIAKELQPWVRTFPHAFYEEMFRLREIPYSPESLKKPQYIGHLTNDIIYDRLAPGVRDQLKIEIPKGKNGKPRAKLFQKLTKERGRESLVEHLGSVVAIMKLSDTWDDFKGKLDRIHPRFFDDVSQLESD